MQTANGNTKRYRGVYRDEKTGTWFYSVVIKGKLTRTGGPKRELRRGFKTAKAADSARRTVQGNVEKGNHVERSNETMGEFLVRWLEAVKAGLRPSTWASYEMNVRSYITPAIGGVALQGLTPDRLNALYGKLLERGLSPSSVAYVHTILYGVLDDAERWGDVVRNVAKLANPPKRRQGKSKMQTWKREELASFLASTTEHRLYPALLLSATTGARRGGSPRASLARRGPGGGPDLGHSNPSAGQRRAAVLAAED
jgi:integrase